MKPIVALQPIIKPNTDVKQRRRLATRFWARVETTRNEYCWRWIGGKDAAGYGTLSVNGRSVRAHRLAYELDIGPIPEGLILRHVCAVRYCVNPRHLIPGTHAENAQDKMQDGRFFEWRSIAGAKRRRYPIKAPTLIPRTCECGFPCSRADGACLCCRYAFYTEVARAAG